MEVTGVSGEWGNSRRHGDKAKRGWRSRAIANVGHDGLKILLLTVKAS
jgi:hypothetical protein